MVLRRSCWSTAGRLINARCVEHITHTLSKELEVLVVDGPCVQRHACKLVLECLCRNDTSSLMKAMAHSVHQESSCFTFILCNVEAPSYQTAVLIGWNLVDE